MTVEPLVEEKQVPCSVDFATNYIESGRMRAFRGKKIKKVIIPDAGKHSEIYIVDFEDDSRYILRAFARPFEYKRYRVAMDFCTGKDLPVPQLLESDDSLVTRWRFKRKFCIENFVLGKLWREAGVNAETTTLMVKTMAKLHGFQSKQWGKFDRLRTDAYRPRLLRRALGFLEEMPDASDYHTAQDKKVWREFVEEHFKVVPDIKKFSLVHHHIGKTDVIMANDLKSAIILDNISLRYGHFAHDLADVLDIVARGNADRRKEVIQEYAATQKFLPKDFPFLEIDPFFQADYHLKRLNKAFIKEKTRNASFIKDIERHIAELRKLTG